MDTGWGVKHTLDCLYDLSSSGCYSVMRCSYNDSCRDVYRSLVGVSGVNPEFFVCFAVLLSGLFLGFCFGYAIFGDRPVTYITPDSLLCKVCFDDSISMFFMPCGHVCACLHCGLAVKQCPVCRGVIISKKRLFFS